MPNRFGWALAAILAASVPAAAQNHMVLRPQIDFLTPMDPDNCPLLLSGDDGGPVTTGAIVSFRTRGVFTDPLPAGSVVTKIEATVWAHQWGEPVSVISLSVGPVSTTWPPGTPIGEPAAIVTPVMHCNVGSPPPQRIPAWHFASEEFPTGFPDYLYRWSGKQNALYVRNSEDALFVIEDIELKIFYEPPPRIEFGLRASTPPGLRRLLLHRYRTDYGYPSQDQERDLEMEMIARVLRWNGEPIADQKVYFRLVDPADSAPYLRNTALAFRGDNHVPPGDSPGRLTSISDTSDAAGIVSATLIVPDHIAGNNYIVEASFFDRILSPGYACQFEDCFPSGEITTWKRVYLEHDAMFRKGTLLWRDSGPSSLPLIPNDPLHQRSVYVHGLNEYHVGDTVMLVHAPRVDGFGTSSFYSEKRVVTDRNRPKGSPAHAGRLVLDQPLGGDYYGIDRNNENLADGVGILEPNSADSTLAANTTSLSVFEDAFVEYLVLPMRYTESPPGSVAGSADPVSIVPRVPNMAPPPNALSNEQTRMDFARKWFFGFGKPNHQHLIGATYDGTDPGARGRTHADAGTNWSYVYTALIDGKQATAKDWSLNGEVTVHEITHQWKTHELDSVDGNDHCLQFMWSAGGIRRSCTMIPDLQYEVEAPGVQSTDKCAGGICAEWFDGIVGFHFVVSPAGKPAGEYIYLRQRAEPLPQAKGAPNP